MNDPKLAPTDITYVADMLRAILWVQDELGVSDPAIEKTLERKLCAAEAALRRLALEMHLQENEKRPSQVIRGDMRSNDKNESGSASALVN